MITHGSQQFLYILTEILFDTGDIVLVEDPSYFVYLGIMQSHGIRGRGIPMEADGIDLAHLEATLESLKKSGELPRLKALYLVTYHCNPTGTTTAATKKAAALKLLRRYEAAAGHPIYLLEDAAYRENCVLPVKTSRRAHNESRRRSRHLHQHLQQTLRRRRARRLRIVARAIAHGGLAREGQSRFRHHQFFAATHLARAQHRRVRNSRANPAQTLRQKSRRHGPTPAENICRRK